MFVPVFVALMMYVQNTISGYIEKVVVSGCETCQLMLTCRQLDSIIAILDTNFIAENPVDDTEIRNMVFPPDNPRDALNKRCSGLNHCSFILTKDSPGSEAWGAGNITIKYACATQDKVQKYCNTEIKLKDTISSGFLHNPGYPRFYAGQRRCVWKIRAPIYQKLKLRMLDVALFDTRVQLQEDCKDTLEIRDSGQIIYSTCTQEHPPFEVISASESVEIVLRSRQNFNPKRGILIHYSTLECPPPSSPPERGYLVFSNESLVTYACCKGYVFPDTQSKIMNVRCIGASWNVSLPLLNCELPETSLSTNLHKAVLKPTETMASELIAPILLMLILFVLNGVVVYYIHKARKNFFRQTRPSINSNRTDQVERGLVSYGSTACISTSTSCSSFREGNSLKTSETKNWALSLKPKNKNDTKPSNT